jgi:hypothetical protein
MAPPPDVACSGYLSLRVSLVLGHHVRPRSFLVLTEKEFKDGYGEDLSKIRFIHVKQSETEVKAHFLGWESRQT